MRFLKYLAFAAVAAVSLSQAQAAGPEKTSVKLSVGGKPLLYYLPLTIAERQGYFKDAGLNVEISDFAGGSQSLKALLGGSVDATVGAFDHTIQMQAKSQAITATILLGRYSGIALGIAKGKAAAYKGPQDLKGMKIGVTAPGSSTNFFVNYMLTKANLKPSDATFIGIGAGAGAVAAIQHGELDAIANLDPVISQLESTGDIKVVADGRTTQGSVDIYGGPYPAAVMYLQPEFMTKNPGTTQALTTALYRALQFIQKSKPAEIAASVPEEYYLGNKDLYIKALADSLQMYSPDGLFTKEGADVARKVLAAFDPDVQSATIDLSKTYNNRFAEAAAKGAK